MIFRRKFESKLARNLYRNREIAYATIPGCGETIYLFVGHALTVPARGAIFARVTQ